ncbi:hypothetical protein [Sphingobacterium thalpophilum]|uniref:hypothetical protein n=1 Tax=Sphingobacterium thalpophilum TaxID=259 RepID=UPI0024A77459|nr:hypothetical protein [Sphingobacterium thalpophilum]
MEHIITQDLMLIPALALSNKDGHDIRQTKNTFPVSVFGEKDKTATSQGSRNKKNTQHMNTLYYSFMMSFLKEHHPDILKSINRIYEPDLSKISTVIDYYCDFMGIPPQQIRGEYIKYKDIQHRYKAIAVVLRIFQPEKLDNLKTKVKSNIYKELGPCLKINSDTLQKSIICACNQFDMYKDFKIDVKQAANYYLINTRFNGK